VLRAALSFLAVPVGPGSHRIELRLEPPLGVVCADGLSRAGWLVLALGASAAALLRWRRRRSGPPC
jgi:hypothetical protein